MDFFPVILQGGLLKFLTRLIEVPECGHSENPPRIFSAVLWVLSSVPVGVLPVVSPGVLPPKTARGVPLS